MSNHERINPGSPHTGNQEGAGKPRQELIRPSGGEKTGHDRAQALTEQDAFYSAFWDRFIEKASLSPATEDPAFWPLRMFADFEHIISERDFPPNPARRELGEKLAPIQDSIRRVRTAYEILAYPQCRYESFRECIEDQLEADRQLYGRDQVALNDVELEIVGNSARHHDLQSVMMC